MPNYDSDPTFSGDTRSLAPHPRRARLRVGTGSVDHFGRSQALKPIALDLDKIELDWNHDDCESEA